MKSTGLLVCLLEKGDITFLGTGKEVFAFYFCVSYSVEGIKNKEKNKKFFWKIE